MKKTTLIAAGAGLAGAAVIFLLMIAAGLIIYPKSGQFADDIGNAYTSIVLIPNGTAGAPPDDSGMKQGFQPREIRVVIGLNNTVRWINEDLVSSSVMADNSDDPNFFNATTDIDGNPTDQAWLNPNESFEFTFTKTGIFGYHSVPHPWMKGMVIVLS